MGPQGPTRHASNSLHRGRPSQELHGQNEAGKMCNVYVQRLCCNPDGTACLRAKETVGPQGPTLLHASFSQRSALWSF